MIASLKEKVINAKYHVRAVGNMILSYPKNLWLYMKSCVLGKSLLEYVAAALIVSVTAVYVPEFLILAAVIGLITPLDDLLLKFVVGVLAFGAIEYLSFYAMEIVLVLGSVEILRFIGSVRDNYAKHLATVRAI